MSFPGRYVAPYKCGFVSPFHVTNLFILKLISTIPPRGPNLLTPQVMKPDLIAPGVDILGAWTRHKGPTDYKEDHRRVDFNIISGTSMSCPHVSGIAAIIKSVNPNWSPAAIRSALICFPKTLKMVKKTLKRGLSIANV